MNMAQPGAAFVDLSAEFGRVVSDPKQGARRALDLCQMSEAVI